MRGETGQQEIRQNGLRIKDKFSLRTSVSRIPVVTELAPDAMYDVIFVVLRYTQLDSVLDTLRANRTKNIVFVGNNVQARALAAALPEKNVLFAFALSAGHREADRVVSIDLKKITIGQLPGATSNKQLIGHIFHGTKYKVVYEPNMEDYLLCHAAFVMPAAFACYKTDGDLKKLRGDTAYLNRVLDANIEGYRAIRDAGHTILPKEDADFEGEKVPQDLPALFQADVRHLAGQTLRLRPRHERHRRNERAEPGSQEVFR